MMLENCKIGFIGAGNMNSAIIGGLVNSGHNSEHIIAADRNFDKLAKLQSEFHVRSASDNKQVAIEADVIILGVKPNTIAEVCEQIAGVCHDKLIISIAAGITLTQIASHFSANQAIIRVMPNTPCLIGQGAIGMCPNEHVSKALTELAHALFSITGHVEIISHESLMDLVTALSGSGPAYFFYVAEAMLAEAEAQGLSSQQASQLIFHTMAGAAAMLKQSELAPETLRENVTSPGGTTAAALEKLTDNEFTLALREAIRAGVQRGKELAD